MNNIYMGELNPGITFEITYLDVIQLSKLYVHIINEFLDLSQDEFENMCHGSSETYIDSGEALISMAQSFYDGTLIDKNGSIYLDHEHYDLFKWQLEVVESINRFEEKLMELDTP